VYVAGALLAAGTVAAAGLVGFVGLLVPHLVRMAGARTHRTIITAAALLLHDANQRTNPLAFIPHLVIRESCQPRRSAMHSAVKPKPVAAMLATFRESGPLA